MTPGTTSYSPARQRASALDDELADPGTSPGAATLKIRQEGPTCKDLLPSTGGPRFGPRKIPLRSTRRARDVHAYARWGSPFWGTRCQGCRGAEWAVSGGRGR